MSTVHHGSIWIHYASCTLLAFFDCVLERNCAIAFTMRGFLETLSVCVWHFLTFVDAGWCSHDMLCCFALLQSCKAGTRSAKASSLLQQVGSTATCLLLLGLQLACLLRSSWWYVLKV